jgi:RHS repeat-associated protein
LAYDYNGNILKQQQWGLKINASPQIDNLKYTYIAGTNKLKSVTDFSNDALTKLGDFKTNANHPQSSLKASLTAASTDAQFDAITDYTYDDNGNLSLDNNKSANSTVTYNHLNLPQVITITGKGSITYTYDAGGNKLRKVTFENPIPANNNKTITTTTNYINGLVYESKTITPQDINTPPDYTDVLQYIPHEEGRIRFKPAIGNTPARFAYDYSISDQVGNTRITLTDEQQQDKYPMATFEPAKLAAEKKYYSIADAQIVNTVLNPVTGLPTYPNNNGIGNNPSDPTFEAANSQYLYKLNGGDANTKMGLGITLKVMAGDRIDVLGKSYYFLNNPTPNAPPTNVQLGNILSGFLGGASGALTTNVHGPISTTDITNTPGINATNGLFANQQNQSSTNLNKPRAFINYIFFDEQFNCVATINNVPQSGASMVGNNSSIKDHFTELQNLVAQKNGFVYIYCSNETAVDVFFDNLQVVHTRGAILEENSYYPFGERMFNICAAAANGMDNRKKYNGIEFDNDLDINTYEAQYRDFDPQTGRWWQIDPKVDEMYSWSAYSSNFDNPIRYQDPLGDEPDGGCCREILNAIVDAVVDKGKAIANIPSQIVDHPLETIKGVAQAVDPIMSTYNFGKNIVTKGSENVEKHGVGYAIAYAATDIGVDIAAAKGVSKVSSLMKGSIKAEGSIQGAIQKTAKGGGLVDDIIKVRHHTSSSGLSGIKKSGSINASRGVPYGVDVEVAPFLKPSQVQMGQAGRGGYVEFSLPSSQLSPIPGYMGGTGNPARIVTGGSPLNLQNKNPSFTRTWLPW